MLYVYNGKIYVRPFESKLIEVKISKDGNEWDVKATEKIVEMNDEIKSQTISIDIEEAYKMQNKSVKEKPLKEFDLD